MWNDEYLLAEGQYVYSENLDIYREPRWIQLAVKPTNYKTGLSGMVYIIGNASNASDTVTSQRDIWFAFENKDIYDAAWTLRYDGSTLRPANSSNNGHWRGFALIPPTNGATFWDYNEGIFVPYTVVPPANATWFRDDPAYTAVWTDYTFPMETGSLASTGMTRPFYNIGANTFFGDSADHYDIEITSETGGMTWGGQFWPWYATLTTYAQGIDQPWDVTFASVHSDSVWSWSTSIPRLYTELSALSVVAGSAGDGVKQLQVDRYSKILHGVNKNNTDILVAWDVEAYTYANGTASPSSATYSQVYIYKHYWFGADAQQLIAKSKYSNNIEVAFENHGITYYLVGIFGFTNYNWARINDMVYCISNKDNVWQIYAYGRTFAWAEDAWSVIISKNSAGKTMKRIGCLYRNATKNGFFYSYEDEDGVFGVDYYDDITIDTPTSFQPSGKIFLRTDDGGDMSVMKEVLELKAWVYVPENTTIKISYILDNSGVENDYATITHTTQGTNDYKKYRGNEPVKWFKCISWFAELTTSGTKSPNISNFNYDLWIVQA